MHGSMNIKFSKDGYKLAPSFYIFVTIRLKNAVCRRLRALSFYISSQRILMDIKLFECFFDWI